MTRNQWKALHSRIRNAQQPSGMYAGGWFYLMRDETGRLGLTQRHPAGHVTTRAAIVRVLGHAAASRSNDVDHRIFIQRVRLLREKGTWL